MSSFIKRLVGLAEFDAESNLKKIESGMPPLFNLPADLSNPALSYMLERTFLEDVSTREQFCECVDKRYRMSWIKINRLPVSPLRIDDYDLLSRWQGVLSAFHAWDQTLIFLLQRRYGETGIYIGVKGSSGKEQVKKSICAFTNSMPGIDIECLNNDGGIDEITELSEEIISCPYGGAVTGIPSFRKSTQFGLLQTLDKLAFGIKGIDGFDENFSMIVVAKPIPDNEISDMIGRFQQLGSEIHTDVKHQASTSRNLTRGEGSYTALNGGISFGGGQAQAKSQMLQGILQVAAYTANFPATAAAKALINAVGVAGSVGFSRGVSTNNSVSVGQSLSTEYLNKFAEYTEKVTDVHCERLRSGRDIGFWNAGVYVLSNSEDNVKLVTGILRSIYSGDSSRLEPIRTHIFQSKEALSTIKSFNLVPVINPAINNGEDNWHMLGPQYQYVSTPVNTEELSLFTSLPRADVPGIRFVKNAVRFANNPGKHSEDVKDIPIGNIVCAGITQSNQYTIPINSLVRHSLIVGSTGCGKTTTSKRIINGILSESIPVLIVEPAKDEWVRWAIDYNKTVDALDISEEEKSSKRISIYEPGLSFIDGEKLSNLHLNPFQPAAIDGAPIDMQSRCEQITALINASLPTGDILPIILEEAIYEYLNSKVDDFEEEQIEQLKQYPLLEGALPIAKEILQARGYEKRVTDSLVAALETRFKYLTRGKRGKIFNELTSTSYSKLFNKNCVINLSKIPNVKDKALIMSVILLSLYEYRNSAYNFNKDYRNHALNNELMHLTVIEEAHNVLSKPSTALETSGNPQQVVADLFSNMISEIRSLGEGLMIIDQSPTKLIPDAIKNTNYKICHRLSSLDDCTVLAQALALRDDQKGIIPMLEQGHAIISGDMDDAASWVKITNN